MQKNSHRLTLFASRNSRAKQFVLFIFLCLMVLPILGCAKKGDDYVEQPVEQLYNNGFDQLMSGKYDDAAKSFTNLTHQHPYSIWAPRAEIMSAYAKFLNRKYIESASILQLFIDSHPGNPNLPYAYYLKAYGSYIMIEAVDRDQSATEAAHAAFSELVRRFPNSPYATDARLKLDLTRDHLAGKEMAVGRWYQNQDIYVSAINRFRSVVETMQTTSHVAEALHRLVECYLSLGLSDEAIVNAAVLGYNFPDSSWYEKSYDLVKDLPNVKIKLSDAVPTVPLAANRNLPLPRLE